MNIQTILEASKSPTRSGRIDALLTVENFPALRDKLVQMLSDKLSHTEIDVLSMLVQRDVDGEEVKFIFDALSKFGASEGLDPLHYNPEKVISQVSRKERVELMFKIAEAMVTQKRYGEQSRHQDALIMRVYFNYDGKYEVFYNPIDSFLKGKDEFKTVIFEADHADELFKFVKSTIKDTKSKIAAFKPRTPLEVAANAVFI